MNERKGKMMRLLLLRESNVHGYVEGLYVLTTGPVTW